MIENAFSALLPPEGRVVEGADTLDSDAVWYGQYFMGSIVQTFLGNIVVGNLRYKLIDWIRGTASIDLLDQLRSWQYQAPEVLFQRQQIGLQEYFAELKRRVPMFAQVERFEDLPILDKRFVNAHRDELLNSGYRGNIFRKKTGGSTGEPLVYFTGLESQSYLWAGLFLAWEVAGYRLGDRVAFLAGSSLFGTGYKQHIYYRLLNVTLMSAFNLSAPQLVKYGETLERGGFKLLYGYASAVHRIARHYLNTGKRLRTELRSIVCTAETLTPLMRVDIEAAFNVPCFSQYGCNDAGISAFECEHRNGYHLLSTRCYAEVLSEGKLISTDLSNRAMFLPRYDTGDLVKMTGRICACGRGLPIIDEVVGRQNDIVIDPNGAAVHSLYFTEMFRADTRIHAFQVVFDSDELTINLHLPPDQIGSEQEFSGPYLDLVRRSLDFPSIRFVFNEPFLTRANSKHRFVMRRDAEPED